MWGSGARQILATGGESSPAIGGATAKSGRFYARSTWH
jgi:hypothetical protein